MKTLVANELPLDKKVLIEASAGTGKTYTIGLIVLRLLLEKLIPVEKIILVTFTEAATAELKKKTSEKLSDAYDIWKGKKGEDDLTRIIENAKKENAQIKEANLLDAIARIDELPVFTIHGFCRRLLNEFALEIGIYEDMEIITDQNHIKNRIVADFWRRNIQNINETESISFADLAQSINVVLNHPQARIEGDEKKFQYVIAHKLALEVREKLREEKEKLNVMSFDDLIGNCYAAVNNDMEKGNVLQIAVRKKYDAILVDEFQDTDKMQFEIFDYLFKGKPFFMIGDPKQAIYRFRGGDIFAYGKAKESAGENQFLMNKNYRSEETLLEALNDFFEKAYKNKMGEGIDYTNVESGKKGSIEPIEKKDGEYKSFVIFKGEQKKVQRVVIEEIKRLLGTGKFEPKNIAILLNKNKDCLKYKYALSKIGISAIVKGGSVFSSEAAGFLRVLLNAICHNNSIKYILALLANSFCGLEPKAIKESELTEWTNRIYEAKEKWEKYGIMNAIDFFMAGKLWGQIAANKNGERNITNIRQLMQALNEEEIKFGKVPEKINSRFAELCGGAEEKEENEERLETDEEALQIMTIHKSKGLEFDIVFVPDIGRKPHSHRFPHVYAYHDGDEEVIGYFAGDERKEASNKEEDEETARLLYVALTRAKSRLYVAFSPPGRTKSGGIHKAQTSYGREIFENFCESKTSKRIQIVGLDEVLDKKYKYNKSEETKSIQKQPKPLPDIFPIKPAWQRTSFTGISQKLEQKDHTYVPQKAEIEIPAGKRTGTLLHSIFENLDFNANESEIQSMVESTLGGFKEFSEDKKLWVKNKVETILNKNLPGKAGKLKELEASNKVAELNFSMKSEKINLRKIKDIMQEKIYDFEMDELPDEYIKGAIDLVFLGKDGKYYILDWKSNSLGDFSQNGMEEAMTHSGYHLQYYIYAVALKRWLEKIHDKFDFKKQFGGAYYVFIRGVEESGENGIYFAEGKSVASSIEKLDKVFTGEAT